MPVHIIVVENALWVVQKGWKKTAVASILKFEVGFFKMFHYKFNSYSSINYRL